MKPIFEQNSLDILLIDDDIDDCLFFEKALKEIPIATHLTTFHDGERLMRYLSENPHHLPDVLFLDLSMPRKTGFECLSEIRENSNLENLYVVVFSTSFARDLLYEQNMINMLLEIGAQDYIRKPGDFTELVQIIHNALLKVKSSTLRH